MGVRILTDRSETRNVSALYCSTSDVAFGPLFSDGDEKDSDERAEAFLRFLSVDARRYSDAELMAKYSEWLVQEDAQYAKEVAAEREGDDGEAWSGGFADNH